jgi:hypothetical protein
MFATMPEVWLFVDWLLTDIACRTPSGKNQENDLVGFWITYWQFDQRRRGKRGIRRGPAYIRVSDLALRRYIAIRALREQNVPLKVACQEVGRRLGKTSARSLNSISTGFLKYNHPRRDWLYTVFLKCFRSWMETDVKSTVIDQGIPILTVASVVQMHAESLFGDRLRASLFKERWIELACRAIFILMGEHALSERYASSR